MPKPSYKIKGLKQQPSAVNLKNDPLSSLHKVDESRRLCGEEPETTISWFSETSKKSVNLEKCQFTNFVATEKLDRSEYAQVLIDRFNKDKSLSFLSDPSNIKLNKSHAREKEIIKHYFDLSNGGEFDETFDHLVKYRVVSEYQEETGSNTGAARVIAHEGVDTASNTYFYKLIFMDPYHLFLPSKHRGTDKYDMRNKSYSKYKGCKKCLSDCID